ERGPGSAEPAKTAKSGGPDCDVLRVLQAGIPGPSGPHARDRLGLVPILQDHAQRPNQSKTACGHSSGTSMMRALFKRIPPPRGSESRSEEHTSELQSRVDLVCRLLLEKTK